MVKTYDPASWDCAAHFMQDRPQGMSQEAVKAFTHDLAIEIQQTIEDWFEDQGRAGWSDGLDDGPYLPGREPRKKPEPKSAAETKDIRSRAWATRREKYGKHGHR
jgi:hypothetical protein